MYDFENSIVDNEIANAILKFHQRNLKFKLIFRRILSGSIIDKSFTHWMRDVFIGLLNYKLNWI